MQRRSLILPVTCMAALLASTGTLASSHREAPFITGMPKVDGTDFYMFRSYEPGRENFVTIVANYPAAAGSLRWAELLHDGFERVVRDPLR